MFVFQKKMSKFFSIFFIFILYEKKIRMWLDIRIEMH